MNHHKNLSEISKINDNIFVSGIMPLEENPELVKKLDIKYIVSCVDRRDIAEIHDKIMIDNPDVSILYLSYNDNVSQNLWRKNNGDNIKIIRYANSLNDYNKLTQQLNIYKNKPMIEIAYNFIDAAIMKDKNVLIHCMAGISRSVSVASYYFMKKYFLNFDDAYGIIRYKRHIANPNSCFKQQLRIYNKKKEKFIEADADNIIGQYSNIK